MGNRTVVAGVVVHTDRATATSCRQDGPSARVFGTRRFAAHTTASAVTSTTAGHLARPGDSTASSATTASIAGAAAYRSVATPDSVTGSAYSATLPAAATAASRQSGRVTPRTASSTAPATANHAS